MAIFDAKLEFSDDQDVAAAQTTTGSTNVFNFVDTDLEMGAGEPLWFNCRVGTEAIAATSGSTAGACTLVVSLVNESNTTIDSSSVVVFSSKAFTEAELTKGDWLIRIPLPYNVDDQKYIGVLYTIGGDTAADGKVDTWIDHGPQSSHDTQVSVSNI
ncbi:hypothetical protein LCGC14_1342410 [marine sediment metagenome]|uniref:Uncharacterized protein n=1 Tax=marine sediment metagenome TaxID=412755 RepID=A0A0F9NFL9_9ZZZZ